MERTKWFEDARFGMFIHWGLYSILGRGEWVMHDEQIPVDEYATLAEKFNPCDFDMDSWISLAKDAGMKYVILTTRHHDGFSLFDSKVSDFTSVKTAAKRDFVAEYVKACCKANLKVGLYYSLLDWRYPVYFKGPKKDPEKWKEHVEYVHSQVRELMTNYGKIDYLFYDGEWIPGVKHNRTFIEQDESPEVAESWHSEELNAMVRKLQPHIIINNRSGIAEDVETPEQNIVASEDGRVWESNMTMNDLWGYAEADDNWKSTKQIIQNLICCVGVGGNYALNIGPEADGTVPVPSVERFREIGKWMKTNNESIYGCGKAPFKGGTVGLTTANDEKVYLHVFRWSGEDICIGNVNKKVTSAHLLEGRKEVSVIQKGTRLFIGNLPEKPVDPYDTVIVLNLK